MAGRIRVAFSVGSLYGGGTERQLVQILQHLDRDRFEPYLYLIYRSGELLSAVPDDVPVTSFDTRTTDPKLYWPGRMHGRRVRDFAAWLTETGIHVAYDRTFHMTLIAAPATARAGVRRVSTIVTDPARDFPRIAGRFRRLKYRLLQKAYRTADAVVGVSDGISQAAAQYYGLERSQLLTIHNSLDLSRVDSSNRENPFADDDDRRFHIVAAGRLHPQKGFDLLIRATAHLVHQRKMTQVRVHILGDGPEHGALEALIQAERVSDNVVLEGYRKDALDWFRHADLFCLSSRYEGLPNALMEAMACRVPVVAFDCPCGPRELLRDGAFGAIVPAEDVEALAAAIGGVHDHYDAMKPRTEKARQWIESDFALPAGVRKLESLLDASVHGHRSSVPA